MRRISKLGSNYIALIALLFGMILPIVKPVVVEASGETITGTSSISVEAGTTQAISDIQINGSGDDVISVRLFVPEGWLSMTTTTGLTFDGDSEGTLLEFSGSRSNINTALATLQYQAGAPGVKQLEVSLTGANQFYYPSNGHVYEVINNELNWTDAKTAAEGQTAYGSTGYLATISSQEENNFVAERLAGSGWFGASDASTEGDWKWVTGPETGTSFWSGDGSGSVVPGQYANWAGGEPNDSDGEDCGQMLSGEVGDWNDLSCTSHTQPAYIVEYGATGNMPDVEYAEKTITITSAGFEISNCAELEAINDTDSGVYANVTLTADIDCQGVDVEPLYSGEGPSFMGTFDGAGHTIRNVVVDESSNSYIGIFGKSENADFYNLNLENINVSGNEYVGSLVGFVAKGGSFNNIHASNITINATNDRVGGLIGRYETVSTETLTNLSVNGGQIASVGGSDVGGLFGFFGSDSETDTSITINKIYSDIDISATGGDVGGLFGEVELDPDGSNNTISLTLSNAYTWGDVNVPDYTNIGGIIGRLDDDEDNTVQYAIQNVYSRGHITGSSDVGGLIGANDELYSPNTIALSNSFAMGQITATNTSTDGGIIGEYEYSGQTITSTNNFYDVTRTGVDSCDDDGELTDCTVVNVGSSDPDYFINNNTNAPFDTWDFEAVWVAHSDTPPTFAEDSETPDPESSSDSDPIPDSIETSAPNSGDANNDGTADSTQTNVSSYINPVTGSYVVLQTSSECSITATTTTSEDSLTTKDSGYNYPVGLTNFTTSCGTAGFTATINLYYYNLNSTSYTLRKHNPNTNAFYTIANPTLTNLTIDNKPVTKVTYQVTDGSNLDLDNTLNGTIVDPVGLATQAVGAPNTGLK